jgi:hypothetical protein
MGVYDIPVRQKFRQLLGDLGGAQSRHFYRAYKRQRYEAIAADPRNSGKIGMVVDGNLQYILFTHHVILSKENADIQEDNKSQ